MKLTSFFLGCALVFCASASPTMAGTGDSGGVRIQAASPPQAHETFRSRRASTMPICPRKVRP